MGLGVESVLCEDRSKAGRPRMGSLRGARTHVSGEVLVLKTAEGGREKRILAPTHASSCLRSTPPPQALEWMVPRPESLWVSMYQDSTS